MFDIEAKIILTLPDYLRVDISIALVSLLKLGYYPGTIFGELNQMSRLSIFNKDQAI